MSKHFKAYVTTFADPDRSLNDRSAVKVDRSTRFGNPYRIGEVIDLRQANRWGWNISPQGRKVICANAVQAVLRFRFALIWDEAIHDELRKILGGRNLACWCSADQRCHADPLLFVANSTADEIHRIHAAADRNIRDRVNELLAEQE